VAARPASALATNKATIGAAGSTGSRDVFDIPNLGETPVDELCAMGLLQTPADIFRLRGEARHGATQAVGVGDAAAMEDLYSIDANVAVAADLLDRADREEAETHAQRLGTKVSVSTPRKTDSAARGHRADVHMAAAEALRDGGCPLRCWKAADRGGRDALPRCLRHFLLGVPCHGRGRWRVADVTLQKLMRVTRPVCCNWRVQVGEWLGTWVLALGGIGQWRNPGDEVGKGLPNAISTGLWRFQAASGGV